ncbi:hypothetical protein QTO34_002624 [Cnephaeus nilssonii]|uniref:Peptidase M14 domain-containing protein n=1 Tax=Cnephaeus nilssonii TaxID=3371016 RepID=A0AA40HTA8_CNENI|nr:hypothetical protein QTO34_002624 [Eptesicus nilssonii]
MGPATSPGVPITSGTPRSGGMGPATWHRHLELLNGGYATRSPAPSLLPAQSELRQEGHGKLRKNEASTWDLYLLGMLVPGGLGYDRSQAQHRQEVVDKTATPWSSLETYPYNRYHPMGEIYQWMSLIREKYTEVVTQHFLGMTYEARPMYYLKSTDVPSRSANHPVTPRRSFGWTVEFTPGNGLPHAFCQWFVREILQNYQDNSRIKRLLRNLDFYVLPVLNIDGYIYTWTTDRLWRKSRSSHNNGTCFGTDLNRNFNVSWCSIGASKNCTDLTFCGTEPASEPETKAVSSFIESKKKDIVCFLTIHSYGQLILMPYGYTKNKPSNYEELIQVGQKAANALKAKHGTNYRVGSSIDILWFVLPEAQIQATCEETMAAVLSILDDVYEKYWYSNSAGK